MRTSLRDKGHSAMKDKDRGSAIQPLALYLGLLLAPLLALLVSPIPPKGGFWWNLAIGCGFAALVLLQLQFFLTARLRWATAPFGADLVYYFHRLLACLLCGVVLLHPLVLLALDTSLWTQLHPGSGRWQLQSGVLSLVLLAAAMVTSVWRRALRLPYHQWRRLHLVLALGAVTSALAHMHAVNYYSAAPLVRGLWCLLTLILVLAVLYLHLLRPWRLLNKPWRVSEVRAERADCWTLTLQPDGHAGLQFLPGQFAWLSLGHSPFSLQEHPFSLASAPRPDGAIQFTIKELGDFTRQIGRTRPGARAWVDGPHGVFSCERYPEAPGYVFIGGGIGIAPLLGMLQVLAARGDPRPHLLLAAHSRFDRIPRREELVALAARLNLQTIPVLESPPEQWQGERGWLTVELLARHLGPPWREHEFFLCGPKPMTDLVTRGLRQLGIPATRIHSELFVMA